MAIKPNMVKKTGAGKKGAWGGVPAWAMPAMSPWGKGAGKGGWAWVPVGGKGGGKGGKGKGAAKQVDKFKEKLSKIDSSLKVWVGGLSKKVTWKELEKHFTAISKPAVTDVNEKRGTGVVAFKSEDDVSNAIATLNGSELCGSAIEVDVWTKPERKEKQEGEEGEKKEKRPKMKQAVKTKFGQKPTFDQKTRDKLAEIDDSLKVFIGGLAKGITWKDLEKHVASLGTKPSITDVREKSGRACLAYKEEGDVANAISSLNGTELKGKTIEADVWTKPEKKA